MATILDPLRLQDAIGDVAWDVCISVMFLSPFWSRTDVWESRHMFHAMTLTRKLCVVNNVVQDGTCLLVGQRSVHRITCVLSQR